MHAVTKLTGKSSPSVSDIAKVDVSKVTEDRVSASLTVVRGEYHALGASDQLAKSSRLRVAVCKQL